jgi:hypothetical protein
MALVVMIRSQLRCRTRAFGGTSPVWAAVVSRRLIGAHPYVKHEPHQQQANGGDGRAGRNPSTASPASATANAHFGGAAVQVK